MRPDIRDRIARHAEDNRERDLKEHERVRRAVEHRRTREEFLKWKEKMGFDMYLTASQILMILTCQRDMNEPKHPEDEWSEEFRTAIELIPEARRFVEDSMMDCIEVKK